MKETIEQLNEQRDYITRIFEEGKIGSVIYNSYALVHQIAIDALQVLTEKDATINALREALNDAKDSIQVIDAHGERPWEVTKYCDLAIELIDAALGEGDKE